MRMKAGAMSITEKATRTAMRMKKRAMSMKEKAVRMKEAMRMKRGQ